MNHHFHFKIIQTGGLIKNVGLTLPEQASIWHYGIMAMPFLPEKSLQTTES